MPSLSHDIPNTNRHPNNTKSGQFPNFEVITLNFKAVP